MNPESTFSEPQSDCKVSPVVKPEKPQRRAKKPGKALRRPLSAYNLFYKSECEVIKNAIRDGELPEDYTKNVEIALRRLKGHRSKAEFQAIASTVGERWKSLPQDRRAIYESKAEDEMTEYKKRKIEYRFALIRECETAAQGFYSSKDAPASSQKSLNEESEKSSNSAPVKTVHINQERQAGLVKPVPGEMQSVPCTFDSLTLLQAQAQRRFLANQVMASVQQNDLWALRAGLGLHGTTTVARGDAGLPAMAGANGLQMAQELTQASLLRRRMAQEDILLQMRQKKTETLESRLALLENLAEQERRERRAAILRASFGMPM